jgi:AraC-like DNA-binding protein
MLNFEQFKVQNRLQFVQMNAPRLDRLSALVDGLAPVVTLTTERTNFTAAADGATPDHGLVIYLLSAGALRLHRPGAVNELQAPALVALQAQVPHHLERLDGPVAARLICAHANLTGPVAPLFLQEFAEPRALSLVDDEPTLRLAMTMIELELAAPRCGQPALLKRVGDILFIGLLRYLVAHPSPEGTGLFNGLADPRIARALVAMHQRPGADWSLERLAHEAGQSRTAFAATFRQVMRQTPGKYLSALRLALAQRAVTQGKGLKEAARIAGYGNTSALSRSLSRARLHHAAAA